MKNRFRHIKRGILAVFASSQGFSLPSVMVGVGLLGVSAMVISQTIVNARRSQKMVDVKISTNKSQQAILDALTERVKEFVVEESCSGARWSGSGSTAVEKAFNQINVGEAGLTMNIISANTQIPAPLNTDANLKPSGSSSNRCNAPAGPVALGSGQAMNFCMQIAPNASPISYRLLDVLAVPVNLASDQPSTCANTRGSAAGIKVTWQIFTVVDNSKIGSTYTTKFVNREGGTFLISAETQSFTASCSATDGRIGDTDQCTVTVSGLGRRAPILFNNGIAVTGINWTRDANQYDKYTVKTFCALGVTTTFRVQSYTGSDFCNAVAPIPPVTRPLYLNSNRCVGGGPFYSNSVQNFRGCQINYRDDATIWHYTNDRRWMNQNDGANGYARLEYCSRGAYSPSASQAPGWDYEDIVFNGAGHQIGTCAGSLPADPYWQRDAPPICTLYPWFKNCFYWPYYAP